MRYSSEVKAASAEMVKRGASYREAAKAFSASDVSVRRWCDAAGVMPRHEDTKPTATKRGSKELAELLQRCWGNWVLHGRKLNLKKHAKVDIDQKQEAKCQLCVWAKHSLNKVNCMWEDCEMGKTLNRNITNANKSIGSKLCHLRKNSKKSQQLVADFCDIHQTTLSEYERGECLPSVTMLNVLADYYEVSLAYLLGDATQIRARR